MSILTLPQTPPIQPRSQKGLTLLILAILTIGMIALSIYGWRQSVLFLIGILFGISLYHASFGFASAYRKLFVYGEVKGIFAQILMLTVATILFAPILIKGSVLGQEVTGAVFPVAVQGAIGAFLFGIGMQLGSGCACGTLYTIGGGSGMMMLTLLTFCLGSFWGTLTRQVWSGLPQTEPVSLIQLWGWSGVAIQLLAFLMITLALWRWQKRRDQEVIHQESSSNFFNSLLYGPWSLIWGSIALAVLNWLTLIIAGRPWGVTWGFTLWAAKIAQFLGWNPSGSEFWSSGGAAEALSQSIFADAISVINLGVIVGAALAAALAGRLSLKKPVSRFAVVGALFGGLLMGYGARLSFGCNVGAYFSGIASTSLHGWLWIAFALLGTVLGIRMRSLFRLSN